MNNCKFARRHVGEMLQCSHCAEWFHLDCVGIKKTDPVGVWPCPSCRLQSSILQQCLGMLEDMKIQINSMQQTQHALVNEVAQLKKNNTDAISEKEENKSKENKSNKSTTTKKTSKQPLQSNTKKQQSTVTIEPRNTAPTASQQKERLTSSCVSSPLVQRKHINKKILIGSSLIKDILPAKLKHTEVKCLPGARISDVTDELLRSELTYDKVTVVAGGNDCDDGVDVIEDMTTLIITAKEISKGNQVAISSIYPRVRTGEAETIKICNIQLEELCKKESVTFCNNDANFCLADHTINDALFKNDGIHLNIQGSNKLAKNLKLDIRPGVKDVCSRYTQETDSDTRASRESRHSFSTQQTRHARNDEHTWQRVGERRRYHRRPHTQHIQQTRDRRAPERKSEEPMCWNCGTTGHTQRQCYHKSPVRCYQCGVYGHKANRCDIR